MARLRTKWPSSSTRFADTFAAGEGRREFHAGAGTVAKPAQQSLIRGRSRASGSPLGKGRVDRPGRRDRWVGAACPAPCRLSRRHRAGRRLGWHRSVRDARAGGVGADAAPALPAVWDLAGAGSGAVFAVMFMLSAFVIGP